MNGTAITKLLRHGCISAASLVISVASVTALADQAITDISFNSQPNGQLSIALEFDSTPSSEFSRYTIEDPARIVVDLPVPRSPKTNTPPMLGSTAAIDKASFISSCPTIAVK